MTAFSWDWVSALFFDHGQDHSPDALKFVRFLCRQISLVSGAIAMGILWWVLALLASRGTAPAQSTAPSSAPPPTLATSAFLVMAFWTGIAFWHALGVPALLGAASIVLFWSVARGSPAPE